MRAMIERVELRSPDRQMLRVFQPHVIVPAQFWDALSAPLMPEKRLMIAILEDAVSCLRRYRSAKTSHERRIFREAEEWLMDCRNDWPFSFEKICDTLGLDPDCVRRSLQRSCAPADGGATEKIAVDPSPASCGCCGPGCGEHREG